MPVDAGCMVYGPPNRTVISAALALSGSLQRDLAALDSAMEAACQPH